VRKATLPEHAQQSRQSNAEKEDVLLKTGDKDKRSERGGFTVEAGSMEGCAVIFIPIPKNLGLWKGDRWGIGDGENRILTCSADQTANVPSFRNGRREDAIFFDGLIAISAGVGGEEGGRVDAGRKGRKRGCEEREGRIWRVLGLGML
jgi:hypothetical protein